MVQALKVLFLAAEATPFAKVGGLADVAGELPRALRRLGVDIRLCMPLHTSINPDQFDLKEVAKLEISQGSSPVKGSVFEAVVGDITVWLIDGEPVRQAAGVYGEIRQDAVKFIFTSLAALRACEVLRWIPDILHANDWHTAAAVMQLKKQRRKVQAWRDVRSLFTIHNLPYMGIGAEEALAAFEVPIEDTDFIPKAIRGLPLPQAILQADWVNTVSPTYAKEIMTPEYGAGLEMLLQARKEYLSGILNGIDPDVWDPATDPALVQGYDRDDTEGRQVNKLALQTELGLEPDVRTPLIGLVARLDAQKGMDLLWPAISNLSHARWQLMLLGSGDPELERMSLTYAEKDKDRVRVILRFDPDIARRIYAGCDLLLIPSRYEPCGLTQMIAMRYGCVPVVRATGGLVDTVTDADQLNRGTGFVFNRPDSDALRATIERAMVCYNHPRVWDQIQRNGMEADFGWARSAGEYKLLYQNLSSRDVS